MQENLNIIGIKKEYEKIDGRWLHLHLGVSTGLAAFAMLMEITMFFVICAFGEMSSDGLHYFLKYELVPSGLNALFLLFAQLGVRNKRSTFQEKSYLVSLMMAFISFVVFSSHNIFSALYLIFAIPVMMTVVYSSYLLTTLTAAACFIGMILGEFFVTWDPNKVSILTNEMSMINFGISLVVIIVFYTACLFIIRFEKEKNTASIKKEMERFRLKEEVLRDSLTGMLNKKALLEALEQLEKDSTGNSYLLAIADIDKFKQVNDEKGHLRGDLCLQTFGQIVRDTCGTMSSFRFGGDEFCLLFKNQSVKQAVQLCSSIQQKLCRFAEKENLGMPLTVSFGLAKFCIGMSAAKLVENADKALYCAKGKEDGICVYPNIS